MLKFILAATAALTLAAPLAAAAQDVPSYAQTASADEQIRGRVLSFDGGYDLAVRDERGFVDNIQLHRGTIINPTGITLEPGMIVSVIGFDDGPVLAANEIDTPYTIDAGIPYYAGHTWDYYGPSIDLAFFFGNAGWWHGNEFAGGFRYDRGARVYANVHVNINDRVNVHDRVNVTDRVNVNDAVNVNSRVNDNDRVELNNHVNDGNQARSYGYREDLGANRAAAAVAPRETNYRSFGSQRPTDRSASPAYRATTQINRSVPSHAAPEAPARGGNPGNHSDDHHH